MFAVVWDVISLSIDCVLTVGAFYYVRRRRAGNLAV